MGEGRKVHTAEGLSSKFGSASAKWGGLTAVVEAANNFLGGYAPQTAADVQRLLYDAATNPGSLGASVMITSHTPNFDPVEEKKKEEEARDALLEMLKEQIRQSNERISKMIDKCLEMAEWCRKQAEKAAEAMDNIAARMTKNSEFINEADGLFESFKTTGHFDREKARKILYERGVNTKEDVGDAKLLELMQKEWTKALKDNTDLSEKYEDQKKEKEKFEARQKELVEMAKELKERRDAINNDEGLSLPEKAEKLKELEDKYSPQVQYTAAKLEKDDKSRDEQDSKVKKTVTHSIVENNLAESAEDFLKDLETIGAKAAPLTNKFVAAANPVEAEPKAKENNLENDAGPAENKLKNPIASV